VKPAEPVERVRVRTREESAEVERADSLAVEEPLELRLRAPGPDGWTSFVVTMRTPGQDEALAAGLLHAEGVLESRDELLGLERPSDPRMDPEAAGNVLLATLAQEAFARAARLRRATVMGSACGVCGKTSIDNVLQTDRPPVGSRLRVAAELLYRLPEDLRRSQSVFSQTGGLHAAGLFGPSGELRALCEDIGRHNATDKLVGTFLMRGELPLSEGILVVSGRAGFEIVQKAFAAGIPIVASVSAPSSLAVELADAAGITLVGFLRDRRFNIYTHFGRVDRST
jgi:FdhD protein